MINYQQTKFKEFKGELKATISDVEIEENTYYDSQDENSTRNILNITFDLVDPSNFETIQFVQKYVKPLTGGNGLFQQLLDAKEFLPDLDGGSFDEQELVGLKLLLTFDKNKKGYQIIKTAVAVQKQEQKQATKSVSKKKKDEDDDLPFN